MLFEQYNELLFECDLLVLDINVLLAMSYYTRETLLLGINLLDEMLPRMGLTS